MPEEMTETTETDADRNWRALQAERDELLKEVRPYRAQKAIKAAGFDPETGTGMALADLIGPDDGADRVKELAEKYGWAPEPTLTDTEAEQVTAAIQGNQIRAVTSPDAPPNLGDEIAQAEADGNWALAGTLKLQQFASMAGG